MASSPGAWLSIGALARATGIPAETLRTWEGRYGYPAAERARHPAQPLDAVDGVDPVPRGLALGYREAVAALPGAQRLDGDAGGPSQGPDRQPGRAAPARHAGHHSRASSF